MSDNQPGDAALRAEITRLGAEIVNLRQDGTLRDRVDRAERENARLRAVIADIVSANDDYRAMFPKTTAKGDPVDAAVARARPYSAGGRRTIPLAAPNEVPALDSRWVHQKTGHLYEVDNLCMIEATMTWAVHYHRVGGGLPEPGDLRAIGWVRPVAEFMDGRFVRVRTEPGDRG